MFVFLIVRVNSVSADTITVDDDDGGDYTKIQDAINAAKEGDTIFVEAGVYYENVVVNKTLTLVGRGSDNTTIDGSGKDDVIRIEAPWVNVSRFQLMNSDDWGAGIQVLSDNNTINENNCSGKTRYGIRLESSNNNTISNNVCNDTSDQAIMLFNSGWN